MCYVPVLHGLRSLASTQGTENTEKATVCGAFIAWTFPALHPEEYLSVRGWDASGDETEIGLIRSLEDWPEDVRSLIRSSLNRRYLLRRVEAIHSMELGTDSLNAMCKPAEAANSLRWAAGVKAWLRISRNGKLITDTEDNRYVIPMSMDCPPRIVASFASILIGNSDSM